MNRALHLPYDTGPHDDTPSGHSFAAAWWALLGFAALDALMLFQWAAVRHFFG